jgi:RNA polymerase sigma-70 factor (ECF subfamily)
MTDSRRSGHSEEMDTALAVDLRALDADSGLRQRPRPSFAEVYDEYFDFIYRSVRRLGIREAAVDDAVQDVFVVVHRRLEEFEGRSSLKTWLFGIALRVVKDHRRRARRKDQPTEPLRESLVDAHEGCPHRAAQKAEAVRLLHEILDTMDDDKRAIFVMAELEQMSAPEIAEALDVKLNTVYSRLRAARALFEMGVKRHRARAGRSE